MRRFDDVAAMLRKNDVTIRGCDVMRVKGAYEKVKRLYFMERSWLSGPLRVIIELMIPSERS